MIAYALLGIAVIAILARGWNVLTLLMLPAAFFPPFVEFGARYLAWPAVTLSTKVTLALLLCAWFARATVAANRFRGTASFRAVGAYLLLVTASVAWSVLGVGSNDPTLVVSEFVDWCIPLLAFFALAGEQQAPGQLGRSTKAVAACMGVVAAITLVQMLGILGFSGVPAFIRESVAVGKQVLWFGSFRAYGTMPNLGPNFFGAALLLPTTLFFARALTSRGIARWGWWIGYVALITAIVATYSRGALFGAIVATLAVLVIRRRFKTVGVVSVMVVTLAVVLSEIPLVARVVNLTAGQRDVGAQGRLNIWRGIIAEAPRYPIGRGFHGWPRASARTPFVGDEAIPVGGEHASENQWLRELAERGILGVLALAVMLFSLFRAAMRARSKAIEGSLERDWLDVSAAGLLGASLAMLTGDHLEFSNVSAVFWYFLGTAQSVTLGPQSEPVAGPLLQSEAATP